LSPFSGYREKPVVIERDNGYEEKDGRERSYERMGVGRIIKKSMILEMVVLEE
jgi:hypothetical protein